MPMSTKVVIRSLSAVLFALLGGLLVSCVTLGAVQADSTSQLPSIAQKYEERFQKTQIGMEIDSFFPGTGHLERPPRTPCSRAPALVWPTGR